MSNNINNLGFNAVNFNGKSKVEKEAPKCECPECKQTEGSAMEALESAGRAQLAFKGAYEFDAKKVEADVMEFQKLAADSADNALDIAFKGLNDYALSTYGEWNLNG